MEAACRGEGLQHDPQHADPTGTGGASPSSEGAGFRGHTVTMNNLDSDLEIRMGRQKEQRELQQLEHHLQNQRRVVENLRREVSWLQQILKQVDQ